MQVLEHQTVRLGHVVSLVISTPDGYGERVAKWKLASTTNRNAGELGVQDTALGARLLGTREGDEFNVCPDGGEQFSVTVLSISS